MEPRPSEAGPSRTAPHPVLRKPGDDREVCRLALAIAAAAFDIAPEEIDAPQRRRATVADARHVAIYLAHIVFQLSMQGVARGFRRDRTTIGHAVRRVEDRRDDPEFDRLMERLERLARFCRPAASAGEGAP